MSGMTDNEVAGCAEELKNICSDYQQHTNREKELIRNVRRGIISPHASPIKLVVSSRYGGAEIELENQVFKATRHIIWWALNSDRSIPVRVKDNVMQYLDDIYNPDYESKNPDNRVCIEMIEAYCRIITDDKEKRNNEARMKIQKKEQAKRAIAGVLISGELHITYQKKNVQAVLNKLFLKNRLFIGYSPFNSLLSETGISEPPELKIYLHHEIRKNDEINDLKVCAGSLKKENGRYYLNNTILLGSHISLIEKWLKACYAHLAGTPKHLRNDPDFPVLENITEMTQKDAERLAEIVIDHYRNGLPSEKRALELIRKTLGDDALDQLKNEKCLVVRSRNGRNYIIRDDGEVSDSETGRRCCVIVGGDLPRYDIILAKYLAIRDRPETIKTLQETGVEHDPREEYRASFNRIIQQHVKRIEQMGFQTGDFIIDFDAKRSVWSMSIPCIEVTIKGGRDFSPIIARGEKNDLTMELWDRIEANKLTPEFLHSAEYMTAAFDYYLAYLEGYLAWSPEYVILTNGKNSSKQEKIRRIIERMEMGRTQERDR